VIEECAIVVIIISHEKKHLAQWQKKCHELHMGPRAFDAMCAT
jgi:hypothetical protein